MPRFCVEPRPYRLIRAQKQNPFFLARAAAISLCKFRRRCFFFSPRLPASPPLETTTRASCHHRRLVSHPATAVSSRLQPPPRETTTRALARLVWRPSTTTRDHCRCLVPLSVSLQVFRRPSTTTRTLSFFCRNCRAAVFFKVNFERVFV